jgi:hypothetical protein
VCLAKYYSDDQIKENEMSKACGTYGGRGEKNAHSFGADRLDHTGIGGSVINSKARLTELEYGGVDSIHLAQDRWAQVAGCCEHGNKPLGSIKCEELFCY